MYRTIQIMVFTLVAALASVASAETKPASGPVGFWSGDPAGDPVSSTFVFEIQEVDGKLSGQAHILHEAIDFPLEGVTLVDGTLTLDLGQGDSYVGILNEQAASITGTLTLATSPIPLKLDRVAKMPVLNRPQLPLEPLPYSAEDVAFENPADKVPLSGTLTIPCGSGPFPAVVLVSGSGPHDRDAAMFGHKPFLVLADHLARRGIACLRVDDRGVGKSGGEFNGTTGAVFAADACAALRYLQSRPEIDPRRVGLCGHSEGGVSAPLVAAEHPDDVAFLVLLASVGVPGEQLLYEQMLVGARRLDEKTDPQEVRKLTTALSTILRSNKSADQVRAAVFELFVADAPQDAALRKPFEEGARALAQHYSDPARRWLITHDPVPTLKQVKCPVLALTGGKDVLCDARQNLKGIEAALRAGGNNGVTCVELPGLNHFFQTCSTGLQAECSRIDETFASDALKRISDWILGMSDD